MRHARRRREVTAFDKVCPLRAYEYERRHECSSPFEKEEKGEEWEGDVSGTNVAS